MTPIQSGKPVKLVVWDLDNTIWDGVLIEDGLPQLRPGILELLRGLDSLGVLQSVASRNDHASATTYLERLGILEYFLSPQISWSIKSIGVKTIAGALNVALDSILFIDDQPFELEEVAHACAQVRTLNAAELTGLLDDPHVHRGVVTGDARNRRAMYIADEARRRSEEEFKGPSDAFMTSLKMVLRIARASREDLDRAEELTIRTNQLNSTGCAFSRAELDAFTNSRNHDLLIISLEDRFGDYGKIGLVLINSELTIWTLKLLVVSCRVLSRGVGTMLLNHLAARADIADVCLQVEFRETGLNRPMKVALMMAGFKSKETRDETVIYVRRIGSIESRPAYVELISAW